MTDTTDLGCFSLPARQPSLAAAAQAPGRHAVSHRLAALEARLGIRRLNRTTRSLNLTREGEPYLEDGEQTLRNIENRERSLSGSRETPHGLPRINATFGFARQHLSATVRVFLDFLTKRFADYRGATESNRGAC